MEVRVHQSVDQFRAIAEPLYRRDPILHTVELTLLRGGNLPDDSLLVTVWNGGTAVGAALQTPPYPLACNGIPSSAIDLVAGELARWRPELTGVDGVNSRAYPFAAAWHATTGRPGRVSIDQRLYRLGTLRPPTGVAGTSRLATEDDRGQLVDWMARFINEAFERVHDETAGERLVETAKQVGDRFVVWDVDGVPVSLALLRAPAAGVSRIGPVYTARNHRGHGYGSAVTAAAAVLAHRSGTPDVVLFTDLANPVSNAIYQRIGFEPVVDSVRIEFASAS